MSFRVTLISLDGMGAAALQQACHQLNDPSSQPHFPIHFEVIDISEVQRNRDREHCAQVLSESDLVLISHLHEEAHAQRLVELARDHLRPETTSLAFHSSGAVMQLIRVGRFSMRKTSKKKSPSQSRGPAPSTLRHFFQNPRVQKLLKRFLTILPRLLALIPGRLGDMRTFIESYTAWMEGSPENIRNLILRVAHRHHGYQELSGTYGASRRYPDTGAWHPKTGTIHSTPEKLIQALESLEPERIHRPRIAILVLRGQILANDTLPIEALVEALESRRLNALVVFGSIFDYRPVLARLEPLAIDILVNLAGFPLVGGHVESRPQEAIAALRPLDVPYLVPIHLSFQTLDRWHRSHQGLHPVQVALNVALPELDGGIEPTVLAGPGRSETEPIGRSVDPDNLERFAERVRRWTRLRTQPRENLKIAISLFRYPPGTGSLGTASYLDVFQSLHQILLTLRADGYDVGDIPETPEKILEQFRDMERAAEGELTETHPLRIDLPTYRQHTAGLSEIERHWGAAPGALFVDGSDLILFAVRYGNIFVGAQPGFGYDGDPMKLLFVRDASPTHGFAAYQTYVRDVFAADAVIHLGTHGALEFMPGKEAGLSGDCWPTRLIGDVPNLYVYNVNNPAEGAIARRRSSAALISHLTPPLVEAGLYKELANLKDLALSYRRESEPARRTALFETALATADRAHLPTPREGEDRDRAIDRWLTALYELEGTLIASGLHVFGRHPKGEERLEQMTHAAAFDRPEQGLTSITRLLQKAGEDPVETLQDRARKGDASAALRIRSLGDQSRAIVQKLLAGESPDTLAQDLPGQPVASLRSLANFLERFRSDLAAGQELEALRAALRGRYLFPSPGGDPLRNPSVLPTGRNIHGLSPDHIPSPSARSVARITVKRFLDRCVEDRGELPESVSLVLWAMDNIKTGGESLAIAFELLGVRISEDSLGRLRVVTPIPLAELERPRIDVVVTVSGIFRDVFPGSMALLDSAVQAVADLDEPEASNRIRKRTRSLETSGLSPQEARLRIFGNGPGAYGGNLNYALDTGAWENDAELAKIFRSRKSFAFVSGEGLVRKQDLYGELTGTADCVLQSLDSVEIGLSDVDHYFDYLGGLSLQIQEKTGRRAEVYLADTTTALGRIDRLEELGQREARVKLLNPKWYSAMIDHGYEGVTELRTRLENLYGLQATTRSLEDWVFDETTRTFVEDRAMAEQLAELNPEAFRAMVDTLLEARDRSLWNPAEGISETLEATSTRTEDALEFSTT
ncbi:MAG: magnesium chelatase subunit H [Planctomycetota bacterium]|nr:magnesium chelatase subunit H [Planctomycetota bacterium]